MANAIAADYEEVRERLFKKTNRAGPVLSPDLGRCWEWTGKKLDSGRGLISIDNRGWLVYRASWVINYGPIPDGMQVLHRCDNPKCLRPNHLFLGTNDDNRQDSISKGRHARGERQGVAVLTEEQVLDIRKRYRRYSHQNGTGALAREFGVKGITIWKIVKGLTWRHV